MDNKQKKLFFKIGLPTSGLPIDFDISANAKVLAINLCDWPTKQHQGTFLFDTETWAAKRLDARIYGVKLSADGNLLYSNQTLYGAPTWVPDIVRIVDAQTGQERELFQWQKAPEATTIGASIKQYYRSPDLSYIVLSERVTPKQSGGDISVILVKTPDGFKQIQPKDEKFIKDAFKLVEKVTNDGIVTLTNGEIVDVKKIKPFATLDEPLRRT
jgi:hypothetical protein